MRAREQVLPLRIYEPVAHKLDKGAVHRALVRDDIVYLVQREEVEEILLADFVLSHSRICSFELR